MTPQNLAADYARLKTLIEIFDLNDPSRIFNVDESGFIIKGMTINRSKFIVQSGTRGKTRKPKFKVHMILSTSGQRRNPLLVLPGIE